MNFALLRLEGTTKQGERRVVRRWLASEGGGMGRSKAEAARNGGQPYYKAPFRIEAMIGPEDHPA